VTRFLLGIAEAGFFPGVIYYLTLWFPAQYRGRIFGLFLIISPLNNTLAAPLAVSSSTLSMARWVTRAGAGCSLSKAFPP